jgi:putative phosphoribosyl transferase
MAKEITIPLEDAEIVGSLDLPQNCRAVVLFAHGSGSGRFSPRNNFVAKGLAAKGLGTFLVDLLTEEEDAVYATRFNIPLLTKRLTSLVEWLGKEPSTKKLHVGLFGASTGAAAALETAASLGEKINAVVSRGGRPDLALASLHKVKAPSLLIVGGDDFGVIELNEEALDALVCTKKLEIVPHATHLFEEPGCLEEVTRLAAEWFVHFLA